MNSTDTNVLKFQCGCPVFVGKDVCALFSPTLREIAEVGYDTFLKYIAVLTNGKPDAKDAEGNGKEAMKLLAKLTDFQYLILLAMQDKEVNEMVKSAFRFFTHENVAFSWEPAKIIVGEPVEERIIDEAVYSEFRALLRRMCFIEVSESDIILRDDDSEATRRLKLQMLRNRELVAKAKARQNRQEASDIQFTDLVGSVALGVSGLNGVVIWDMTYYMFQDQLKRMGWKEQYQLNQRAALAGAKLKKDQLQYWIRTIASDK